MVSLEREKAAKRAKLAERIELLSIIGLYSGWLVSSLVSHPLDNLLTAAVVSSVILGPLAAGNSTRAEKLRDKSIEEVPMFDKYVSRQGSLETDHVVGLYRDRFFQRMTPPFLR